MGSAGVSVNIFNYISKLFNIPLLSVATSFVAEDISKNEITASGGFELLSSLLQIILSFFFGLGFDSVYDYCCINLKWLFLRKAFFRKQ